MKILAINISLDKRKPKLIKDNSDIIDILRKMNGCNSQIVNNLYIDESVINHSLVIYDSLINEIFLKKEIKDFKIFNYPLINFTKIAQKIEPSWQFIFCIFLSLIEKKGEMLNNDYDEITIVLPSELKYNEENIKNYLFKNGIKKKINFISTISTPILYKIKCFFSKIILLTNYFSIKSNDGSTNEKNISNYYLHSNNIDYTLKRFNVLKSHFKKFEKDIKKIPVIFDWTDKKFKNEKIDHFFFKHKPSLFEVLSILINLLKQQKRLSSIKDLDIKINGHYFNSFFIWKEMSLMIIEPYTFKLIIDFSWLRNFCSSITIKTNFFFADEFYLSGKIINVASKTNSSKIKTYGIQHNTIDKTHNIYRISPSELNFKLHYPDYFLIWNNSFKKLLEKNKIHKATKLIITGSLIHSKEINENLYKDKIKKLRGRNERNIKILWAITNDFQFKIEKDILKNCKRINNVDLMIRNHPNSHVKSNDIKEFLINTNYSFSKNSLLKKDISESDIIICAYSSTVSFDAIMLRKKVILTCDIGYRNMVVSGSDFEYCSNSKELECIIKNYEDNIWNKKQDAKQSINKLKLKDAFNEKNWMDFISKLN